MNIKYPSCRNFFTSPSTIESNTGRGTAEKGESTTALFLCKAKTTNCVNWVDIFCVYKKRCTESRSVTEKPTSASGLQTVAIWQVESGQYTCCRIIYMSLPTNRHHTWKQVIGRDSRSYSANYTVMGVVSILLNCTV